MLHALHPPKPITTIQARRQPDPSVIEWTSPAVSGSLDLISYPYPYRHKQTRMASKECAGACIASS